MTVLHIISIFFLIFAAVMTLMAFLTNAKGPEKSQTYYISRNLAILSIVIFAITRAAYSRPHIIINIFNFTFNIFIIGILLIIVGILGIFICLFLTRFIFSNILETIANILTKVEKIGGFIVVLTGIVMLILKGITILMV